MIVVVGSRVIGPLESYAAGFAAELARLGYTPLSVAGQLRLAAHLSRWLAGEGLDVDALTPMIAGRFLAARAAAGYTAHRSPKALSPVLGYLRGLGVAPLPTPVVAQGPVEMLLERYCCYLVGERGVGTATARGYAELVRPFVVSRAPRTRSTWPVCRARTWWVSCSPSAANAARRRRSGRCRRCGRCCGSAMCRA